jgi:hypothetical protein
MSFGWVMKEYQVRSIQEGEQASIDIFDFEHLVNLYRLPNGGNIHPGIRISNSC